MDCNLPPGLDQLTQQENDFSESPHLHSGDVAISLISEAAKSRNLKVNRYRGLTFEVLDDTKGVIFLQNSPANSRVFSYCSGNKQVAKILLARKGVPVPSGSIFDRYEDALSYFEQSGLEVAVKPVDGSHGDGVTTGVSSKESFQSAWDMARSHAEKVIVEESIRGYDLRVLVVGGRAVAAYIRVPANVIGDGVSSIRELVEEKNLRRKLNPSMRSDRIQRFDLLERAGRSQDEVPAKDERVWLTSVANVSVGGEVVQFIDHVSPAVLEMAERAAQAFPGLTQVGVDLMVDESKGEEGIYVLEVNANPAICDAVFPCYGLSVNVPEVLLEHVFDRTQVSSNDRETCRLAPAAPYAFGMDEHVLSKDPLRQVELIKQAAHSQGIAVESISAFVFFLSAAEESVAFYQGIPDRTSIISRKVGLNRPWMQERLQQEGVSVLASPSASPVSNQFRLLVVDRKMVAGVCGGKYSAGRGVSCRFDRGTRDITEEIHPGFLEIAAKSIRAIFNPFLAGVDIVAEDIRLDPQQQAWAVNDVVTNPSLTLHHYPDSGLGRDVAATLVRALFPESINEPVPNRCVFVTVEGEVQGVGFRSWIRKQAVLRGVKGWVQNTLDGKVEMLMEGSPKAVEELLQLCEAGPNAPSIHSVSIREYATFGLGSFLIRQ